MKATDLLKKQHREVKALFRQAKKADADGRREILDQIAENLEHHMHIEEDVFYPAVAELATKKTEEMIPEAYEEHHVVQLVLAEFPNLDPEDERFEAKMTVLEELIQHHVDEEEGEMFKIAEKLGAERLEELGDEMEAMPPASEGDDDEEDDDDEADDEGDEDESVLEAGAEGDDDEGDEDDEEEEEAPRASVGPTAKRRSAMPRA